MALIAKASLDVVFVVSYVDTSLIEASLVPDDNGGASCYLPNENYYIRLYKSNSNLAVSAKANFGSITKHASDVIENVTEEIVFSGTDTVSLLKILRGSFTLTYNGLVYTLDHTEHTPSIASEIGSKALASDVSIFGAFSVSYVSLYDLYLFRPSRFGKLLLSFVGT